MSRVRQTLQQQAGRQLVVQAGASKPLGKKIARRKRLAKGANING